MFDLLGIGKVDAREAIQEMMCGATRGLLEAYEWRLEDKQREIDSLKEKIQEEEIYKKRYEELLTLIDVKRTQNTESKEDHPT